MFRLKGMELRFIQCGVFLFSLCALQTGFASQDVLTGIDDALEKEQWAEAEKLIEDYIKPPNAGDGKPPRHFYPLYYKKGWCEFQQEKWKEAENSFNRSCRGPDHPYRLRALKSWSEAAGRGGDLETALKIYKRYVHERYNDEVPSDPVGPFEVVAVEETIISYSSATVTIPDEFVVLKMEKSDEMGRYYTLRCLPLKQDLKMILGDDWSSRKAHPIEKELKDLEYFERDPKNWLGCHGVVLRHGDKRSVEWRYPIENVYFKVLVSEKVEFRPILAAMKRIGVQLTPGWKLKVSDEERAFSLFPPE